MKRFTFLVVVIIMLLITGCDDTPYTYADLLGEWDFPGGVHISVLEEAPGSPNKSLDISWIADGLHYFAMAEGTEKSGTFEGVYTYNTTQVEAPHEMNSYEVLRSITIKLILENNRLKATCTGDAPLGGKIFSLGTKAD